VRHRKRGFCTLLNFLFWKKSVREKIPLFGVEKPGFTEIEKRLKNRVFREIGKRGEKGVSGVEKTFFSKQAFGASFEPLAASLLGLRLPLGKM
jgi:hypothetical protein